MVCMFCCVTWDGRRQCWAFSHVALKILSSRKDRSLTGLSSECSRVLLATRHVCCPQARGGRADAVEVCRCCYCPPQRQKFWTFMLTMARACCALRPAQLCIIFKLTCATREIDDFPGHHQTSRPSPWLINVKKERSVCCRPSSLCDNGKVLPAFVLDLFQHLTISSHLRISHFRLGVARANKAASRPILEIE